MAAGAADIGRLVWLAVLCGAGLLFIGGPAAAKGGKAGAPPPTVTREDYANYINLRYAGAVSGWRMGFQARQPLA